MEQMTTSGLICLKDRFKFEYRLAEIEYIEHKDQTYSYTFRPNYSVISLLPPDLFQGIPGLDLDTHKEVYVRENIMPVFISERTPGENREDLWQLLEKCGMTYLNRLEWLIRTETQYGGDLLYVKRFERHLKKEEIQFDQMIRLDGRSSVILQKLLKEICWGNDILANDFRISDDNRKQFHALLMPLYAKEKTYLKRQKNLGIHQAVVEGKYTGRKRLPISDTKLDEVFMAYRNGKINQAVALQKLNISRSTFFRRLREYNNRK